MLSGMSTRRSNQQEAGLSVVVAPTDSISDVSATQAHAWFQVDSDGDIKSSVVSEVPSVVRETWLESGLNSQVWVIATLSGDSLSAGGASLGVRHACTADRKWGYTQSVIGVKTGTVTINFWDAVSGGNLLDTQAMSLDVEVF
jgi:hypothetical protein